MDRAKGDPDLPEAIDALLVRGPAPSAALRYLAIPGVTASMGPTAAPIANRVGLTDVAPEAADALVADVIARYRREGRGLRWYVSGRSRPADLARRLEAHGLVHRREDDLAGMARATAGARGEAEHDGEARAGAVRATDLAGLRASVGVIAEGFGVSLEVSTGFVDTAAAGGLPGTEFLHYLAFDGDVVVGYASATIDHDRRVALLGGSAVVPAHRGRGHYRALVHARLGDARRRGARAVVAQALRRTSAPILARLGFEEVSAVSPYDLDPPAR